jgi:hypothetical protein
MSVLADPGCLLCLTQEAGQSSAPAEANTPRRRSLFASIPILPGVLLHFTTVQRARALLVSVLSLLGDAHFACTHDQQLGPQGHHVGDGVATCKRTQQPTWQSAQLPMYKQVEIPTAPRRCSSSPRHSSEEQSRHPADALLQLHPGDGRQRGPRAEEDALRLALVTS